MKLIKTVRDCIEAKWDKRRPFLLGYSGGPDSKALLYALLEAKILFHIAHVDHGWRDESGSEAAELAREAVRLGIVFHTLRLENQSGGNLEDKSRLARLAFFRSLFQQTPYQALLLAHHADDLAETSLKRVFEGAPLCSLGGMAKYGVLEGMEVWRPLIHTPKAALTQFLDERRLQGLVDRTNLDPRFLRGRLRTDLIPLLEASFGKNIASNLQVLSERALELKSYLDRQVAPLWESRIQGPWGWTIDLQGVERLIQRHLLQQVMRGSRDGIETALHALGSGSRMKCVDGIAIERGAVFQYGATPPKFGEPITLRAGSFTSGDWTVEIEPATSRLTPPTWKDIWTGEFEASLSDGVLQLPMKSNRETWRVAGVPVAMRGSIPIVLLANVRKPCWRVRFCINVSHSSTEFKAKVGTI